jgi:hypothetical protein
VPSFGNDSLNSKPSDSARPWLSRNARRVVTMIPVTVNTAVDAHNAASKLNVNMARTSDDA